MPTPQSYTEQIKQALAEMPEDGGAWSFAHDPRWTDWVEGLTEKDVAGLVQAQLHFPCVKRLRAALQQAQGRLVRRDSALQMLVACAIAQVNLVYLGPPGTAKSLLVRTFAEALGIRNADRPISEEKLAIASALKRASEEEGGAPVALDGTQKEDRRLFEYLLTRYTTPEELFGGADIKLLMEANLHSRRSSGMLPQAEIAFLDEIFKANSAILNTLLSLTNERIFYNMGQAFRVRLAFVVGASNESPDPHELGALFDRFPIRVACPPVPDDEIKKVLASAEKFAAAKLFKDASAEKTAAGGTAKGGNGRTSAKACLNDVRLMSKVIATETFRDDNGPFLDQFCELFLKLRQQYSISDRTPAQILRVCRALALMETDPDKKTTVSFEPRHLRPWGYIAGQVEQTDDLQRFVQDHISQLQSEAVNLFA